MITFIVEGDPAPKGSFTPNVSKNGRPYLHNASERTKPWENCVKHAAWEAVQELDEPIPPPYHVTMHFARKRPGRPTYKHPARDDLDKVIRCTIDGLVKGKLLEDDRHVTSIVSTEAWASERSGVEVTVTSVPDDQYAEWR